MRRESFRTIQGWGFLILLLIAAPVLIDLARGEGAIDPATVDPATRRGFLLVSYMALVPAFLCMVLALLLRELGVLAGRDPLRAHPWVLPSHALVQAGVAVGWSALQAVAFHALFHLRWAAEGDGSPLRAVARFWAVGIPGLWFLGGLLALLVVRRRPWIAGPSHGALFQRALLLPYLIAFPAFVLLPAALLERSPEPLASLGASTAVRLWLDAETGASRAAAVATTLLLGAGLLGRAILREAGHRSERMGARATPSLPRVRGSALGRGGPEGGTVALFWWKDVWLPIRRQPGATLLEFIAFAGVSGACVLGVLEGARGASPIPDESLRALLTSGILVVAAGQAAVHALPAIGSEGACLTLLRPILEPARLVRAKGVAVGCRAALHTSVQVTAVALVLEFAGARILSPWTMGTLALWGTGLFTWIGIGLGALLPDPKMRSPFLPGSSGLGRFLYVLAVLPPIGMAVASEAGLPVSLLPVTLGALGTGAVALVAGTRRLRREVMP